MARKIVLCLGIAGLPTRGLGEAADRVVRLSQLHLHHAQIVDRLGIARAQPGRGGIFPRPPRQSPPAASAPPSANAPRASSRRAPAPAQMLNRLILVRAAEQHQRQSIVRGRRTRIVSRRLLKELDRRLRFTQCGQNRPLGIQRLRIAD